MKKKILIVIFLLGLIGFQQVEAIEWVWNDTQTELEGYPFQTRAFYSNYTNRFYAFFNEHAADGSRGVYYSTSYDGITWLGRTWLDSWSGQEWPLFWGRHLGKRVDFYLEPSGRYLHHAIGWGEGGGQFIGYNRYELFPNGSILSALGHYQFTYAPFLLDSVEQVSICTDSEGYPYISVVEQAGALFYAQLLRCDQNDGTWISHTKYRCDDVGMPANADYHYRVKVMPLENQGIHWFIAYSISPSTVFEQWFSAVNYFDGTGWHASTPVDDAEGGDWANERYCFAWYGNETIMFHQEESGATDIRLKAQFRNGKGPWENITTVSFDVPGDAGSVLFLPLVSMGKDEDNFTVSFIWGIVGNETLWYRQGEINSTGDFNFDSAYVDWQDCGFNLVNMEFGGFGSLYSPMVVELQEDDSTDWIWYDYLGAVSFPANHLNTTLYNSDGTVNDGWIFEGEVYDLVSYIQNASIFYVNTTDSRHQIRFQWNNETEQQWISVEPSDQFTIGLPWSNFTRYPDNITRLQWRFIPDRSIIDCQNQSWGYYIENTDMNYNASGTLGFETNIYNLGGFTYYDFQGDGGRTTGGHPWELYATNGTEGSSARAEQIYRKLQHLHFLIEIDMDNEWDAGNGEFDIDPGVGFVDIGIDYLINGTWIEGFSVRLYVQSAEVGHDNAGTDEDYVEWSVDWYNYDPGTGTQQNLRSGLIYSNHWGYDNENLDPDYHNRTSSQLWVDLWFDRTNASTTVSGQVNAMYYGMKEHGATWWPGYGEFQPMRGDYENAMFLDDLYDEGGNVTDSLKFDLMRVFVEVGKVADADGDDETWMIRAVENVNRKLADDRMQGIEQPSFEETLVLEMPMFQSLNPLIRAIDGISSSIWKGALNFQKILWGAMDSFFAWAGFGEGFFSRITAFLMTLPDIFITFMDFMPTLLIEMAEIIEAVFTALVLMIPLYTISIGTMIETIMDYWNILSQLLNGQLLPFDIIQDIQLGDWINAGITMLPTYEVFGIIFDDDPGRRAEQRMNFYSKLFGGVINFLKNMASFMQQVIQTIMDILPG